MRLPSPFSTLQSFPFSAGQVLFWPGGGRVWVLNETAAFIWNLLGTDMDESIAQARFADAFSVPLHIAGSAIETALSGFSAQGLLAGGTPEPSPTEPPPHVSVHGPRLKEKQRWAFSTSFTLAGHQFSICADPPLPDTTLFERFLSSGRDPLHPGRSKTAIAVTQNASETGCFDLFADQTLNFRAVKRNSVIPVLLTLMFSRISESLGHCMLFHAAVMVRDGHALLLPAGSGKGKTTLAAALAARGWTFFSDELAPIEPDTGRVLALPMPMSIKQGSLPPLSADYPQLEACPVWHRLDGRQVRYLPAPGPSLPKVSRTADVQRIIFPEFRADKGMAFEPLDKVAVLERLAETGSSTRALRASDVKIMIDLAENTDACRLVFSDTDAAIRQIETLFAG